MKSLFVVLTAVGVSVSAVALSPKLINGKAANKARHRAIVSLEGAHGSCSATIVGTRVLLTAGHCATTGSIGKFTFAGETYEATMTRHPSWPAKDIDVAVGIATEDIEGVRPYSVVGKTKVGKAVSLFGMGCATSRGGIDGTLRSGESVVTKFSGFDMVTQASGGAALCFGDSGGPAFLKDTKGNLMMVGLNSKGNVADTNYSTRLDLPEVRTFLEEYVDTHDVEICGLNAICAPIKQ